MTPSVFLLVTYFLQTVGLPIGPSIRLPIGQKRKCFDWSNLSVAVFFPPHPLLAYSELCQVPQFYSSYLSSYFTYLLLCTSLIYNLRSGYCNKYLHKWDKDKRFLNKKFSRPLKELTGDNLNDSKNPLNAYIISYFLSVQLKGSFLWYYSIFSTPIGSVAANIERKKYIIFDVI